ncbi:hypothetical protein LIA77_11599 [Sarocladium implicatum]|nr:hypothetical protein LIA77_11599 [Sarocladium implicatum]
MSFRAYTDPLNNAGSSADPPSLPPPPPPPPPLNVPPSRARLQLAARLAMHQKNNQAAASSSANLEDDENGDGADPFADADDLDDDGGEASAHDGGRGAWWRSAMSPDDKGNSSDEDDEFGDFAMAEEDKTSGENVILKPLAVNPARDASTRGLSGLWPFSNKADFKDGETGDAESRAAAADPSHEQDSGAETSKPVEVKEAKRRTSIEDPEDEEVVV